MSYVSRYLDPALIEQLANLQLSARSVVEGTTIGQHRSPLKGASVEFRQHRSYVPGDEPRRLDWRVLGRTDRPYVKEYDEETNLRCVLLLDGSGSMAYAGGRGRGRTSKFDYAATLVAALSFLMLGQTESVGLALFGVVVKSWLKPHGGPNQLSRILEALERTTPAGESSLARAMHDVADRLERRALIIAISDFFHPHEQFREGLAHLRHDRHEVIAMQVLDRDEEDFPFASWSRFRGLEGEAPELCEPAVMRGVYLENFQRHRRTLKEHCVALGAELGLFHTDQAPAEALRTFLNRRAGARGSVQG